MSDAVLIKVQDTGSGIAPNDLPHIFEPLYRADKSRREHQGGSGLGLPIAKALVEAHRGRIWAESDGVPGCGTTLSIMLAARAARANAHEFRPVVYCGCLAICYILAGLQMVENKSVVGTGEILRTARVI